MYVHVTTSYIRIWTLHYVLYWYCMYYIGNVDTVHVYTDLLCAEVLSQVVHHRVQLGGGNEAEWEKSESLETLAKLIFFYLIFIYFIKFIKFPTHLSPGQTLRKLAWFSCWPEYEWPSWRGIHSTQLSHFYPGNIILQIIKGRPTSWCCLDKLGLALISSCL